MDFMKLSPQAQKTLSKLTAFLKLPINWNGEGAVPPDHDTVNCAIAFLKEADEHDLPVYFAAPGPNGEVVLEYRQDELAAEIYFESGEETEMLLYRGKDQKYEGKMDMNLLLNHFSTIMDY